MFKRTLSFRMHRALAALGICILAGAASWLLIWAAYGFRYAPVPDRSRELDFPPQIDNAARNAYLATHRAASPEHPVALPRPLLVKAIVFANEHRLLPQAWLYGLLFTYQASLTRPAFLRGEISEFGWWYYFPLAMLYKTPLVTLATIAASLVLITFSALRWFGGRLSRPRDPWLFACIAIPLSLYAISALRTNLNIGLRHVLPLYPLLYLMAAVAFARIAAARPRIGLILSAGILLALSAETIRAHPNYISFFNTAFGGRSGGVALLGDSNLDWGQDLPALAQWQRDHPDEKLYFCYFGTADPAIYGIRYVNMPSGYLLEPQVQFPTTPGVVAVSATKLQGLHVYRDLVGFYEQLRQHPPREVLNGTIYLFNWPP